MVKQISAVITSQTISATILAVARFVSPIFRMTWLLILKPSAFVVCLGHSRRFVHRVVLSNSGSTTFWMIQPSQLNVFIGLVYHRQYLSRVIDNLVVADSGWQL